MGDVDFLIYLCPESIDMLKIPLNSRRKYYLDSLQKKELACFTVPN